jgi:hypothetical protein
MLRFDCKFCGENIFVVQDIDHLGGVPHKWKCCGCGRYYRANANDDGLLIVYPLGDKNHAAVYEVTVPGAKPKVKSKKAAVKKSKVKKEPPIDKGDTSGQDTTIVDMTNMKTKTGSPESQPEEPGEETKNGNADDADTLERGDR